MISGLDPARPRPPRREALDHRALGAVDQLEQLVVVVVERRPGASVPEVERPHLQRLTGQRRVRPFGEASEGRGGAQERHPPTGLRLRAPEPPAGRRFVVVVVEDPVVLVRVLARVSGRRTVRRPAPEPVGLGPGQQLPIGAEVGRLGDVLASVAEQDVGGIAALAAELLPVAAHQPVHIVEAEELRHAADVRLASEEALVVDEVERQPVEPLPRRAQRRVPLLTRGAVVAGPGPRPVLGVQRPALEAGRDVVGVAQDVEDPRFRERVGDPGVERMQPRDLVADQACTIEPLDDLGVAGVRKRLERVVEGVALADVEKALRGEQVRAELLWPGREPPVALEPERDAGIGGYHLPQRARSRARAAADEEKSCRRHPGGI